MKISEEYIDYGIDRIELISVAYAGDFLLRLEFNDGKQSLVDFKPFLKSSGHPSVRKYLDEEKFRNYKIVNGNLNWNNFDMIFPIDDLYQGKI